MRCTECKKYTLDFRLNKKTDMKYLLNNFYLLHVDNILDMFHKIHY